MVCKEALIVYGNVVLELTLINFEIWVVLKSFETFWAVLNINYQCDAYILLLRKPPINAIEMISMQTGKHPAKVSIFKFLIAQMASIMIEMIP